MKFVLIIALTSWLVMACSLPSEATHTPRPTYTPYPTFTMQPHVADSVRTDTSVSSENTGDFFEMEGRKEWFYGEVLTFVERGTDAFRQGRYRAAIDNLTQAQRHRDKPSSVVETWIGLSYQALGEFEAAIQHHSAAIDILDGAIERTNRGLAYVFNGECAPAIQDAKAALTMEPHGASGIHSDAEANYILN